MKKFIRAILYILSAFCILMNAGPILTNGQINIGIITGFAAAVVFFAYACLFDGINGIIGKIWKKAAGKAVLTIVAVCACFAFVFAGVTFVKICSYSKPSEHRTDCIIVLGCQVNGTEPGRYLRSRINKACEYLNANPDSIAILTGGQGNDEDIPEGECMYNCLTEMGIESSRLIVETESTSTMENFRNSLDKARSAGIELDEITVVTNDFHEYRASKFAERNGLKAYPYPTVSPWIGYLPFAVREVYAVIWQIYMH